MDKRQSQAPPLIPKPPSKLEKFCGTGLFKRRHSHKGDRFVWTLVRLLDKAIPNRSKLRRTTAHG